MSAQSPDSVVLWETAVALCALMRHSADPEFEIHVCVDGVLLDRKCFVDDQRAADHAMADKDATRLSIAASRI